MCFASEASRVLRAKRGSVFLSKRRGISDASRELILTVVVQFTDDKDALTHHCDRASSDTMVFILPCMVPVKTFYDP